jgi:hypothetical protein
VTVAINEGGSAVSQAPGLPASGLGGSGGQWMPVWRWIAARLEGRSWILVLGLVSMVYLSAYYVLPGRVSGVIIAQVLVPLMWLTVAEATYLLVRSEGENNLVLTRGYLWVGLLVGSFQLAALIMAGLFMGFGNSPLCLLDTWDADQFRLRGLDAGRHGV